MNHLQLDKCTVLKYSPLQSTVSLEPGLGGHSSSLEMTPYDRSYNDFQFMVNSKWFYLALFLTYLISKKYCGLEMRVRAYRGHSSY